MGTDPVRAQGHGHSYLTMFSHAHHTVRQRYGQLTVSGPMMGGRAALSDVEVGLMGHMSSISGRLTGMGTGGTPAELLRLGLELIDCKGEGRGRRRRDEACHEQLPLTLMTKARPPSLFSHALFLLSRSTSLFGLACSTASQSKLDSRCPRRRKRSAGRTCSPCSVAGKRARGLLDRESRWPQRHSSSPQNCAPSCSCSTWRPERGGKEGRGNGFTTKSTCYVNLKNCARELLAANMRRMASFLGHVPLGLAAWE